MLLLLPVLALFVQWPVPARALPFDKAWDLRNAAKVVTDGGRDVLQVESGFGFRRDVSMLDGTVDFDVYLTDRRSFVYVYFRAVEDGEREEFYLRPHKSALPDAVQYAPVWQGRSAWQLYHGPGATAAPAFRHNGWSKVRVVMRGRSAALFIDDMTRPVLLVPRLARDPKAGYIALGGFLPADTPGNGPIASFANVTVTPGHVPFDFDAALAASDAAKPVAADPGIVRAWSVSQPFAVPADTSVLPPAAALGAFTTVQADPNGLLPLHREIKVGAGPTAAVARIRVQAEAASVYPFELGFSDIATVFVNGKPLFQGNQSYSFDRPRREGVIGFDHARLYLPLEAGDNEVAVLLTDSFGGWGLMGRFADIRRLSVR